MLKFGLLLRLEVVLRSGLGGMSENENSGSSYGYSTCTAYLRLGFLLYNTMSGCTKVKYGTKGFSIISSIVIVRSVP